MNAFLPVEPFVRSVTVFDAYAIIERAWTLGPKEVGRIDHPSYAFDVPTTGPSPEAKRLMSDFVHQKASVVWPSPEDLSVFVHGQVPVVDLEAQGADGGLSDASPLL